MSGPVIGAVAGAIGGAVGGAVGGVVGAVGGAIAGAAGSAIGTAVGAAVGAIATTAAVAAGTAVVATAASNIVQGAPVFRGVGMSASIAAITAGAIKAVSVVGSGFNAIRQTFSPQVRVEGISKLERQGTSFGNKIQQAVRNNFFRPANAPYQFGRPGIPFFEEGKFPMTLLEDYFPAAHNFAVVHDALVGTLAPNTSVLHPANIPTMPPAYVAGVIYSGFSFAQDILEGIGAAVNS